METRSDKLLESLQSYYVKNSKLKQLLDITNTSKNDEGVSLRLVDWLVTNYSKSNNIIYYVSGKPFNMHQSYKNMLKAYSKRLFDPFRRHERIYIKCEYLPNNLLETTVAQLMFFRWAFDNNVIEYANLHKNKIKQDMDSNTQHRVTSKKNIPSNTRQKRQELSKSTKGANIYSVNIKVTFT